MSDDGKSRPGALAGLTVLDLTRMLPGPYCTMLLADLGARVMHIGPVKRGSGGLSEVPLPTLMRNKESILLDLKSLFGRRVLERLVSRADVLVEGFRPGVMARLGAGFERCAELNPGLIYCSISGYGQTGVRAAAPGHDLNYMAVSGLLSMLARGADAPVIPGFQVADVAGGLHAALGILAAVLCRERSGRGQFIDLSITRAAQSLVPIPFSLMQAGMAHRCGDSFLSHGLACYDVYRAGDDGHVAVGALEPRFFAALCQGLGLTHPAGTQYDPAQQERLRTQFQSVFATRSAQEWEDAFAGTDACVTAVRDFDAVFGSDEFQTSGTACPLAPSPGEKQGAMLAPMPGLQSTPPWVRHCPPRPGEHSAAILSELGVEAAEPGD